jgi:cellulose synthase/poly-beta-1,6-N-acetylglucosamine synthase-like glycosyltransferase
MEFSLFNAVEWVASLLLACLLGYLWLVGRAAWQVGRISCRGHRLPFSPPQVSVVIAARNEAEKVVRCLEAVLQQQYPREAFEVILVDDGSEDATAGIAQVISRRHPNLKVLRQPGGGKKAALARGIAAARGTWILQTDADCEMGPHWLASMVRAFEPEVVLVSGPVSLQARPQALERLQEVESMGLVMLGAGSLAAGRPNMVNGANLAFRRDAFVAVGGYAGIDQVASGDDELLLQKLRRAKAGAMRFVRCEAAIVQTPAQPDWAGFKAQRLRWVSKVRAYPDRRVNLVQLLSYLGFWAFPLVWGLSWGDPHWLPVLLVAFGLKLAVDAWLMYQAGRFFHKLHLWPWVLLLEIVYIPYVLWIGLAGNLVRQYEWKGRKVA